MKPVAWWEQRLLCVGPDGRLYMRRHTGKLTRWWYRTLPREDDHGNPVGRGPAPKRKDR